jgi:KDO2-lipid IV(A) lauroyltransferase
VVLAAPIYLLMLLPMPVLYVIADFFIWLARDVIQYRKRVIRENLKNSFPDKSEQELINIERDYYQHMIDVFIETFKALTMSKKEMMRRVTFENLQEITQYFDKGRSVILVLGHYGNWEWGGFSFTYHSPEQTNTLYHPLRNPFFDWLTYKIRARCGVDLIPMQNTMRHLVATRNKISLTAFIADQSPSHQNAYWTKFLNQDTAFFTGAEKIAEKFNYPVVHATINKTKRGYYHVRFKTISAVPKQESENYITETFVRMLEEDIITKPHLWLWSHRRWKHKRPNENG